MSKELKALKEARKFRHEKDENLVVIDLDYFNRCLDGIETALKRLEVLEKELCVVKTMEDLTIEAIKDKKLKALEIIKETFDFSIELGNCPDGTITYKLNVWCKGTPVVVKPISKEKYDLLKEVLL